MSFKPAFILPGESKPCTNAQAFATHEEANASARSRFQRWTMPTDYTVVESDEPVNYRWDAEAGDVSIHP